MLLTDIRDNPGARKRRVRVGRGIGSGCGKTSGAGGKGQTARSGVAIHGFEGGQMPLHRRLPKRGFTNIFRRSYAVLNLDDLTRAVAKGVLKQGESVSLETLKKAGLLKGPMDGVRILSRGKEAFQDALVLQVAGLSESAREVIEKAGGKIELV